MNPHAAKISSGTLAGLFGVSVDTIDRWARQDRRLADCRWRRGWWHVERLRSAGFLQHKAVAHA